MYNITICTKLSKLKILHLANEMILKRATMDRLIYTTLRYKNSTISKEFVMKSCSSLILVALALSGPFHWSLINQRKRLHKVATYEKLFVPSAKHNLE